MNKKKVDSLVMTIGTIMLEHGAETYRVEDTIRRILTYFGSENISVFVIPTSIFINSDTKTSFKRVKEKNINLELIDKMNQLSRDIIENKYTIEQAQNAFKEYYQEATFSTKMRVLFSGMAGGFFSLLFGGSIHDFILAYLITSIIVALTDLLTKYQFNFFIKNFIGGFVSGTLSIIMVYLLTPYLNITLDTVILGPIMALVPGVALTNGMRDIIYGDLVSGSSKITEAVFIAIGIAFGVGIVINFRFILGI